MFFYPKLGKCHYNYKLTEGGDERWRKIQKMKKNTARVKYIVKLHVSKMRRKKLLFLIDVKPCKQSFNHNENTKHTQFTNSSYTCVLHFTFCFFPSLFSFPLPSSLCNSFKYHPLPPSDLSLLIFFFISTNFS